jgi:hypothetical protein
MLVSAVVTILLVRAFLALAGYPQIGGGGLHIAHVLWGGLLMLLAFVLFLSFMGPVIRPIAAVLAGTGAGLFIDEIGKFVTSDNDYFYRPAPAIMYALVVGLVLLAHGLHGRRPHHPAEHLAGAVDEAVAGVVGGLSPRRRAEVERQLRLAGNAPGAEETRALIRATPDDPVELFDPLRFVDPWRWFSQLQQVVRERRHPGRFIPIVTVAVLGFEIAFGAAYFGTAIEALISGAALPGVRAGLVPVLLGTASTAISTLLVLLGLRRVRSDRFLAFGRFQQALLVNLLFTRVFQFDVDAASFLPVAVVLVDVALLAVVTAERTRLARLGSTSPEKVVGPRQVRRSYS